MSKGKKTKDITEKVWRVVQMSLNIKDTDSPFRKMPLVDYLEIKGLFENNRWYVCAKCVDSRVVSRIEGLSDANTGEVLDTDTCGGAYCVEGDDYSDEEHPILDRDDLSDFSRKYGV